MIVIVFLFILPFIIVNAVKFNLVNSSHRSIRMNFMGIYNMESIKIYLFYPILTFLTLGLLKPYIARKSNEYYLRNLRFGTSKFSSKLTTKGFISIYLKALGLILAVTFIFGGIFGLIYYNITNQPLQTAMPFLPFLIILSIYISLVFIVALTRNYIFNNTSLDNLKFLSDIKGSSLIYLLVSNFVLIIISFGLLIPYASIQTARYYAKHTYIDDKKHLDDFIQDEQKRVTALGDSASDILDVDVGAVG